MLYCNQKNLFLLLLFLFYDIARRNKIQFSPIEKGCKLIGSISNRIKILGNLCILSKIKGEKVDKKPGEKSIKKEGEKTGKRIGKFLPIIKEGELIIINMIKNINIKQKYKKHLIS